MRRLTKREVHKRGCEYCLQHSKLKSSQKYIRYLESHRKAEVAKVGRGLPTEKLSYGFCCSFDACPYRELDKYKSYREYLKHKEGNRIDFKGII